MALHLDLWVWKYGIVQIHSHIDIFTKYLQGKIFTERDRPSDQQTSGHHGLHHLGASRPSQTSEHHHHHHRRRCHHHRRRHHRHHM